MILLESNRDKEIQKAIESDFRTDSEFLDTFLVKNSPSEDPLLNLITHSSFNELLADSGFERLRDWLLQIHEWEQHVTSPMYSGSPKSIIPPPNLDL